MTDTAMAPLARHDVVDAAARIRSNVRRTPVMRIEAGQLGTTHPGFWLKLESLQATGAFKARGAMSNLLASDIPEAGVVAASGGNHGAAVVWAAQNLGVPAAVFVPVTCPPIKLARLAAYGARVTVAGEVYDESLLVAQQYAAETGALLVHPFDQTLTVAGAGTCTLEFLEQVPDLDSVLVSVGGGGLLAGGLAVTADTRTRMVGVEPSSARCLGAALDAGEIVAVEVSGPAVDSLGPTRVGQIAFAMASAADVHRIEVTDDAIRHAQLNAWNELRIGVEGGGATALAAVLSGQYVPEPGEQLGVICSGGNYDIAAFLDTNAG